jgi:hypothetical protein
MSIRIPSLLCVFFWFVPVAVAQTAATVDTKRYSLKEDNPATGTHIRRELVTGVVIPMDKAYAALTLAQQALVKEQYEGMGAGDEPPFPADGLISIYKPLSKAQNSLGVVGPLSILVDIDSEGTPISVSVIRSPDKEMTLFVARLLMLTKFKPALCNGQPCRMQYPFRITFSSQL